MANRDVRMVLYQDINFSGRRIQFRRGGVAIRDLRAFRFNDELSSLRLRNVVSRNQVTLVLFQDINYRGAVRVFRGSQNVASLIARGFNDEASSLVVVGRRLTDRQINNIRNNRRPPQDVLEINQ